MKKVIGYIISVVGLIILSLTFEQIKEMIRIPGLENFTNIQLMIIGLVIAVMGILLIATSKKTRKTKGKEIPIYKGKEIVGYRQH